MPEKRSDNKIKWIVGLTLFFIFIIVVSLTSKGIPSSETTHEEVNNMTALQQMTIAFDGGYSEKEIKDKITEAMILYNMPITEEGYSRAGSVLVALRQQEGIEEMLILDYMINKLYKPGINLNFSGAAALSVTILKTGAN